MVDAELQPERREVSSPRTYCPDLQPLLQTLLSTLADIEFDYERERERVNGSSTDSKVKALVLDKLRTRHRERREPYVRQLALLQDRIQTSPDRC